MNQVEYEYYQRLKRDFKSYVFHTQNEGVDLSKQEPRWKLTKFHRYLADEVQKFLEEKEHWLLLLSVPPQHGKSVLITETLPSWYLGKNPEHKVIQVSYGDEFARRFGRRNRDKIERYGDFLFDVRVSKKKKKDDHFELENGYGKMISKGFGGQVTGEGANLIIVDDPVKNSEQVATLGSRDKLYEAWQSTLYTRQAVNCKIIIIQTRWHEDDLYGRLAGQKGVRTINLPAICESSVDPMGRKLGDALCPEIGKTKEWLLQQKEGLVSGQVQEEGQSGLRVWNAMYQGRPSSIKGNILKREWWQYYEPKEVTVFDEILLSVDTAFKGKESSDYVAMEVWGKKSPNYYLVNVVRDHMNFMATIRNILQQRTLYGTKLILIEDKANGTAVLEVMKQHVSGLIAVTPKESKEQRVNAISYLIEAGNVYLPLGKSFTAEFVDECASFPHGKNDDMVDAMTQALLRLSRHGGKRQRSMIGFDSVPRVTNGIGKGDVISVI